MILSTSFLHLRPRAIQISRKETYLKIGIRNVLELPLSQLSYNSEELSRFPVIAIVSTSCGILQKVLKFDSLTQR